MSTFSYSMHDVENIGYDVENATNPRAYARPRTPIRHGQPPIRSPMRARGHQSATGGPPIRSRMRARGHQSATGGHQSARVCAPADTNPPRGSHQSARVCAPADTNPPRTATNPLAYARPRARLEKVAPVNGCQYRGNLFDLWERPC